jgi:hypothetical protein
MFSATFVAGVAAGPRLQAATRSDAMRTPATARIKAAQ